jgi:hypothetical protein
VTARLAVYQSLWAMEDLPHRGEAQWTLAERVERIVTGGFDGLAVDLGARQAPAAETLALLLRGPGAALRRAVFAFVGSDEALEVALRYAEAIEAPTLVVCAQVFGLELPFLAGTVARWHTLAAKAGVALQLETHRGTMTNDLRATVGLLDNLDPAVELAIDLSHHVCGCELPDAPTPEVESLVDALLARAASLQGRVATRGQVQVPLTYPVHAGWVARFRDWWTRGFADILTRRPGGEVMFCCELGTHPYAITGPDGHQLTDRWAEALLLADWARESFAAAAGAAERRDA